MVPIITIAELAPDKFSVSIIGRYGGGFRGVPMTRQQVIGKLAYMKGYDCWNEPAHVICPDSLKPEVQKVFPQIATNQ